MRTDRRRGRMRADVGSPKPGRRPSLGITIPSTLLLGLTLTLVPEANAGWPWSWWTHHKKACHHPGCGPDRCLETAGWAGAWYWMRSPDQEQRVVMALYNRYCIRCHGIDGRGVWDIPDVPDFTDPRWQTSRPDPQIVNILMEGRGAVMPSFRGTLTLEESWAMAHYLRSFVPGTELSRPDVGRAAAPRATPAPNNPGTTAPALSPTPVPTPTTPASASTPIPLPSPHLGSSHAAS